ncbi:MAG: dual specificity protein phosphatase family protein [Abitibacteriaceae bacterium]|nr:dual specificity protein phosphatase family protein [Abditibacteriaceae bacterium]
MLGWFPFRMRGRRRRSPFNNLGPGGLTCGQVTAHLFVGGELGPNDWHALQQAGVSMLINLQQEQQDVFDESERVEGYLWLPAPDGLAPTLEQLAMGVEFIKGAEEINRSVFVHCKAGQGRAPLLCACYLISQGMSHMDAIAAVRKARPQTMLTPEQGVRLREFAAALAHVAPVQNINPLAPITHANGASNGAVHANGHSEEANGTAVPGPQPNLSSTAYE